MNMADKQINAFGHLIVQRLTSGNIILDTIILIIIMGCIDHIKRYINLTRMKGWFINRCRSSYTYEIESTTIVSSRGQIIINENAKTVIRAVSYYLVKNKYRGNYNSIDVTRDPAHIEQIRDINSFTTISPESACKFKYNGGCIEVMIWKNNTVKSEENKIKHVCRIITRNKDLIDTFILDVVNIYKTDILSKDHQDRPNKMFTIANSNVMQNKAYIEFYENNIEFNKTFDDIYNINKQSILSYIDNFINGKVKKLCLLLSGPPGTGKTSFIQAIYNYMKQHGDTRDILNITMNHITADCILESIMNTNTVNITDGRKLTLDTKKKFIVMEDITAQHNIGHLCKSKEDDKSSSISEDDIDMSHNSNLSLSCMLNIIDGLSSLDGTIFIITSNHASRLHHSFTRDGRFIKIYIDYMLKDDLLHMIRQYRDDFPGCYLDKYVDKTLAPATVEYVLQNYSTVSDENLSQMLLQKALSSENRSHLMMQYS